MKYKIKFSAKSTYWDWIRQTTRRKGTWGDCQFFVNEEIDECDFWFIYENTSKEERVICDPENIILITGEPESIAEYDQEYISQFGKIITSNRLIKHPNTIYSQSGVPWFIGAKFINETKSWKEEFDKDYDELIKMESVAKSKLISVISSNKFLTKGHIQRIRFAKKLKEHFGDRLDLFGAGFNDVEDKWDALAPYKYTIVLENSSYNDYWTEKLSDAYLSFCYPIYYGCKNIDKYFNKDAVTTIDIKDFNGSVRTIAKVISENYHEKYFDKITEARNLVLNKYNVFALMSDFVNKNFVDGEKKLVTIHPQSVFEKKPNIFQRMRNKILRLYIKMLTKND